MVSFPKNSYDMLEILTNTKCTIIKFSASWCGPCKNKDFLESYNNLKANFNSNKDVVFLELDVNKEEQLVNETKLYNFEISAVPTIKVYSNSTLINTYTGTSILRKVRNDIESLVK